MPEQMSSTVPSQNNTPQQSTNASTQHDQPVEDQPPGHQTSGHQTSGHQRPDSQTTKQSTYIDFEVSIQPRANGVYPVAVVASPAGEVAQEMQLPLDVSALSAAHTQIQRALNQHVLNQRALNQHALNQRADHRNRPHPAHTTTERAIIEQFGTMLFNALIRDDIRNLYYVSQERATQQDKGLRLKLRISDPQLAALPWEFLYDARQERFLALSNRTPVVRYLELPHPPRPLAAPLPLRILIMIAAPIDQVPLAIEQEKERILTATRELCNSGLLEITWLQGQTWRDLQRAMYQGPWHIFHFIGHGNTTPNTQNAQTAGSILLCNDNQQAEPLTAESLGQLLTDHSSLRLVVLNACNSATSLHTNLVSSTATTLIQKGIPAVLAMQYRVSDQAAVECARSFYQALAFGLPVDTAVAEARKGIGLQNPDSFEWGVPVLYMRTSDGVLYQNDESTEGSPSALRPEPNVQQSIPMANQPRQAAPPPPPDAAICATAADPSTDPSSQLDTEYVATPPAAAPPLQSSSPSQESTQRESTQRGSTQRGSTPLQIIINRAVGIGFVYGWLVGIGVYCVSKLRRLGRTKRRKERNNETIK